MSSEIEPKENHTCSLFSQIPKFWTNFPKLSSVMVSPFYSLSPCTHTYATTPPKLLPAFFGLREQEDSQMSFAT